MKALQRKRFLHHGSTLRSFSTSTTQVSGRPRILSFESEVRSRVEWSEGFLYGRDLDSYQYSGLRFVALTMT